MKLYTYYEGKVVAVEAKECKTIYRLEEKLMAFNHKVIMNKNDCGPYARNTLDINMVSTCPKGALKLAQQHYEAILRQAKGKVIAANTQLKHIRGL